LSDLDDPKRAALVRAFRDEVQRDVRAAEFHDPQGLIQGLSTGILSELNRLQAASARQRADAWLAAQIQDLARQFAANISATALKPGVRPADLYIDLVIAERQSGKRDENANHERPLHVSRTLEEVVIETEAPLL